MNRSIFEMEFERIKVCCNKVSLHSLVRFHEWRALDNFVNNAQRETRRLGDVLTTRTPSLPFSRSIHIYLLPNFFFNPINDIKFHNPSANDSTSQVLTTHWGTYNFIQQDLFNFSRHHHTNSALALYVRKKRL